VDFLKNRNAVSIVEIQRTTKIEIEKILHHSLIADQMELIEQLGVINLSA
jgi:hypothetical protein